MFLFGFARPHWPLKEVEKKVEEWGVAAGKRLSTHPDLHAGDLDFMNVWITRFYLLTHEKLI